MSERKKENVRNTIAKKGGRPSIFTPKLGADVCERISKGESLRSIGRDPKMPDVTTILRWVFDTSPSEAMKVFQKNYEVAREMRAEYVFEETLEIADDTSGDMMKVTRSVTKKGKTKKVEEFTANHANVHRSRLRVDTRKWFLSRMAPKKFADRVDITSGGKAIKEPRGVAIQYLVPAKPGKSS